MRYALNDDEWAAIKSMLPNTPRGVPRMNDSRVLKGIFWVLRSGAPWRDLPRGRGEPAGSHHWTESRDRQQTEPASRPAAPPIAAPRSRTARSLFPRNL
jgi:transposase